jgi:hypothetical protein
MLLLVCLRCMTQHGFPWLGSYKALLEKFDLMHRVVVKDGGNNLTSIVTSLHSLVDC